MVVQRACRGNQTAPRLSKKVAAISPEDGGTGSMTVAMMSFPEVTTDPDAGLVERARRGEREAFDQLVAAHLPAVWRVLFRILRDGADAEDVAQEVFLAAWQNLPTFRGEAKFGTWLHRIAVSRALNHRGRAAERMRRAGVPIDGPEDDPEAGARLAVGPWTPRDDIASPLARLEQKDLARRLARCLERLPATWRAVLALRDGEELSYEEIAGTAGVPIGTVRSRLARARLSLRACLEGSLDA